jgi:alginate O-acetyltransferase complex protein AlgI
VPFLLYGLFLVGVVAVHWWLPARARKPFLVGASYVFYCSFGARFGALLLGLSVFNWAWGRWVLPRAVTSASLALGLLVNAAPLVYWKYTSLIVQTGSDLAAWVGYSWRPPVLEMALPLGISFYTFQGIAYLVDVAAGDEPLVSLVDVLLFEAFWTRLVAGPIVRLDEMRPQLDVGQRRLARQDVAAAAQRILFGIAKKIVIADSLAPYVDSVFGSSTAPGAADSTLAILGFGAQLYYDFSGYSDIAIGSARLVGYRLPENFDWPYSAHTPQEFWNRWHMTLSRWIRDYLYTPLSFALRRRRGLAPLAIVLAMAICGLWHGPRWTFVVWGVWHGALLAAGQTAWGRRVTGGSPTGIRAAGLRLGTFVLVHVGWVFFRSATVADALGMLGGVARLRGSWEPSLMHGRGPVLVLVVVAATWTAQAFHSEANRAATRVSSGTAESVTARMRFREGLARARASSWARWSFYSFIVVVPMCLRLRPSGFMYLRF